MIACQFTARHIRGRPRPPVWYPGFPLYVCDSRYSDRERIFVKIKNWNHSHQRKFGRVQIMLIYPFEAPVFPKRYPSPYVALAGWMRAWRKLRAINTRVVGLGGSRKAATGATTVSQTDYAGLSRGVYVGPPTPATVTSLFNILSTATTSTATGSTPVYQYQPTPHHAIATDGLIPGLESERGPVDIERGRWAEYRRVAKCDFGEAAPGNR